MKRTASYIIGSFFVLGILFGAFYAMFGTTQDMAARAFAAERAAMEAREKARNATCSLIGNLAAVCYDAEASDSTREQACNSLNKQEGEYMKTYNVESYIDCAFKKQQEPAQAQQSSDPLFFGDEE